VAYDVHLADRVREPLVDGSPVTEQMMFGGLAFLVAGKVAVAASSQGGLLVRVDPARADRLLATTNARPMEMKRVERSRAGCTSTATICAPSVSCPNGSPLGQPPPEALPPRECIDDGHPIPQARPSL
jgi:hypothetical protein